MKNLNELLVGKLDELDKNGTIEKIFEDKLTKAFEDSIDSLFRYSGPLKEQLEKYLKENVSLDVGRLGMANYNEFIFRKVQAVLDTKLNEEANKVISGLVKTSLGVETETQKEYSLDEFLRKIVSFSDISLIDENVNKDDGYVNIECSLHVDAGKYLHFIRFDLRSGKEKYECKHSLTVDLDGTIEGVSATISGSFLDNLNSFLIKCKYEGIKIKNLKDENSCYYDLDITDNYDQNEIWCEC